MSHAIERNEDGTYCVAWSGETPWHGLGQKVPSDLTPEQMMKKAGCDWSVEKQPMYRVVNGKHIEEESAMFLVRDKDNKVLDIVSKNWKPLQNEEAFNFFNDFVMAGNMEMHTAGSIKGGQLVWALAKISDNVFVKGKDKIEQFLLFTNPHKFGQSIDVRFTSVRAVCQNTISMALNGASSQFVKLSHRTQFDAEAVKSIMDIAHLKSDSYLAAMDFLTEKKYTNDKLAEFFKTVYPVSEKRETSRYAEMAEGIIDQQPGADMFPGTWYNALQAVTFLNTHQVGREKENRLHSNWFGSAGKSSINAMNLALDFANAA